MRALFSSSVLGIAVLVTAILPSQARAWPPGRPGTWRGDWRGSWVGRYRGWWGGRSWYLGGAGYYPYAGFYYPNYGMYYSPYAYYPPADYSTGAASYSIPESGSGSAQAEPQSPRRMRGLSGCGCPMSSRRFRSTAKVSPAWASPGIT
jgi:hypothetical protein